MENPTQRQWQRLLQGSPLRDRRFALVLAVFLLVLLALAAASLTQLFGGLRPAAESVFLKSLIGATLLSAVPLAILGWLDRRERESPWLFAVAFLWGGLMATSLALPLNNAILASISEWLSHNPDLRAMLGREATVLLGAPIAGPLVEECTKGLGIALLFLLLRAEYDNMRDGFIYGAVVGAGFTWFETPFYIAKGFAEFGEAPWEVQFGVRFALFGLAGHALFSGLFGAFLGLARQTATTWLRYAAPLLGLGLAIAAHLVDNLLPLVAALIQTSAGTAPPAAPAPPPDLTVWTAWWSASLLNLLALFPFLGLMLALLWRSGRWERQVIRQELADEATDLVMPDEYVQIRNDGRFQTRRLAGPDRRLSAALVNAQHELAFRKSAVRRRGGNPDADPLVAGWRDEIRALRGRVTSPVV